MYQRSFEQTLLAAIDGIHAAATGDITWSSALEGVCDFVGARAADLNMFNARTLEYLAFHPARADPFVLRYIADYMSDVLHENPRIARIYLPMSEGKIVADSDIWTPGELRSMPFFADFLQPWGTYDSLNTWVRRTDDGSPWIALAVHFRKEDCPPQAEERRRLGMLLPHIRRACSVEERLGQALRTTIELQEALEHVREAVMLLNENGRVVGANRAATDLLQIERGISLARDETLHLGSSANQGALMAALRRCRAPEAVLDTPDAAPSSQIVVTRFDAAPLALTVQPLPSARRYRSCAVAALFVRVPEAAAAHEVQSLREAYGLTPAELQLVRGLVNGSSLKELAILNGISYETARTYLRRVFDKTGTNRQAALVGLVRNFC
jgi:DNA-binding CsgD family transcriptional regulator